MAFDGRIVYLSDVPAASDYKPFENVPDVLRKSAVAELLGVNVRTISREIQRGRLKCVHVGKAVRITKAQLLEYLEEVCSDE